MNAPAPPSIQPADLWRRATARAIDALFMLMLCALAWLAIGIPFAILAIGGQIDLVFGTEGAELAVMLIVLMVVLALVSVYRYEVSRTARTGQTWGKKTAGIAVVRVGGHRGRQWARWALPHGIGLVAAYGGAGAGGSTLGPIGLLIGVGAGLVGWMLVYASALFGKDRRGWHDKAAGTIVVGATDEVLEWLAAHEPSPLPRRPKDLATTRDDPPPHSSYVEYWDQTWHDHAAGRGGPPPRPEAGEQPDRATQVWPERLPPPS